LDIIFIDDELVSHPLVRYLNIKSNLVFDKIEQLYDTQQDSLFNQKDILSLTSYTEEEFIPNLSVDVFFTNNINEVKHKVKTSVQSKAFKRLMSSLKDHDTEGEHFQ
jgi:hypothetical protein